MISFWQYAVLMETDWLVIYINKGVVYVCLSVCMWLDYSATPWDIFMKIHMNIKGTKADVVTFLFFSISIPKKCYGRKTDFRFLVKFGSFKFFTPNFLEGPKPGTPATPKNFGGSQNWYTRYTKKIEGSHNWYTCIIARYWLLNG